MTVTLPPEWEQFVKERVAVGKSANPVEVLRDAIGALLRLGIYHRRREALIAALQEAEDDIAAGRVNRKPISAARMLEDISRERTNAGEPSGLDYEWDLDSP